MVVEKNAQKSDCFFNNRFIPLFKNKIIKLKFALFFLIIKETIAGNLITICNDYIFLKNKPHLPQHGLNLKLECSSESVILWNYLKKGTS